MVSKSIFSAVALCALVFVTLELVSSQKFGDPCNFEGQACGFSRKLTCKNKICGCDFTWQSFDEKYQKCQSPLGGFCYRNGTLPCVNNAKCSANNDFLGFCLCEEPFVAVSGSSCDETKTFSSRNNKDSPLICCPSNRV
ncbi:unnamed protein product [Allacma fusca]|uniref:Uncharacterized protein n=1 Tax=Allacma fusca TaxID=39272 RepID=A0A8J2P4P9_9HEXA|nr:unnamed protein product [Allacma fusca]